MVTDSSGGSDDLPPLPADFDVPDSLVDYTVLEADCRHLISTLIQGGDACAPLREIAAGPDGPAYAVLAAKFAYETVVGFILNHATFDGADWAARALARFLVTARQLGLPA